jgi:ribosomal protein S4
MTFLPQPPLTCGGQSERNLERVKMSRYIGPKMRVVRRLGFLPGLARKRLRTPFLAGQHRHVAVEHWLIVRPRAAKKVRRLKARRSFYARRLLEKQRVRFNYGMTETQMKGHFLRARKKGVGLAQLLEMRLDSVVYSLRMAPTLVSARQLVTHGHVRVSKGKRRRTGGGPRRRPHRGYHPYLKVTVPGYQCSPRETLRCMPSKGHGRVR